MPLPYASSSIEKQQLGQTIDNGKSDEETESEEEEEPFRQKLTLQKQDILLDDSALAREYPGNLKFELYCKDNAHMWGKGGINKARAFDNVSHLIEGRFLNVSPSGKLEEVPDDWARDKINSTLERYFLEDRLNQQQQGRPTRTEHEKEPAVAEEGHYAATAADFIPPSPTVHKKSQTFTTDYKSAVHKKSQTNKFEASQKDKNNTKAPARTPVESTSKHMDVITRKMTDVLSRKKKESETTNNVLGLVVDLEDIPLGLLESSQVFVTYLDSKDELHRKK